MMATFCYYSSNDYCYYSEHYSDIQTVVLEVKNPSANAGDTKDAGSIPGREDPLEEEMATHSSILAWRILLTEEPGGLQP